MSQPISPKPVSSHGEKELPAYVSNGLVGLHVRDIPLLAGMAQLGQRMTSKRTTRDVAGSIALATRAVLRKGGDTALLAAAPSGMARRNTAGPIPETKSVLISRGRHPIPLCFV